MTVIRTMTDWIDSFPVWGVVAVCFALGCALGLVLRTARRGKYEEKEQGAAEA